eukprot:4855368-Prymnesium_polylepis.1
MLDRPVTGDGSWGVRAPRPPGRVATSYDTRVRSGETESRVCVLPRPDSRTARSVRALHLPSLQSSRVSGSHR